VNVERLAHNIFYRQAGIKRSIRVLKDHLKALAFARKRSIK
jgi:hypothetical protein